MTIKVILILYFSYDLVESTELQIVNYSNITLESCGLNAFHSIPPKANPCLKWHKTRSEELSEQNSLSNIYKGRYASNGEFPFTVLIHSTVEASDDKLRGHSCTGVILNDIWIITVAHCIKGRPVSGIKVYSGVTDYKDIDWNNYDSAEKLFAHESYYIDEFDIGLIKLKSRITTNRDTTNGVCLPDKHNTFKGLALLSGWGMIDVNQTNNDKQLKVTPVHLNDYIENYEPAFFTFYKNKNYGTAFHGDSGGPLVQYVNGRAVLIALVYSIANDSDNKDCGQVNSMWFVNIPYFIDWIKSVVLTN